MIIAPKHGKIFSVGLLSVFALAGCFAPVVAPEASTRFTLAPRFAALDVNELDNVEVELWVLPAAEALAVIEQSDYGQIPEFSPTTYASLIQSGSAAHRSEAWDSAAGRVIEISLVPGTYHFQMKVSGEADGVGREYFGATWFDWENLPGYMNGQYTPAVHLTFGTSPVVALDARNTESFAQEPGDRTITVDVSVEDEGGNPVGGSTVDGIADGTVVATEQSNAAGTATLSMVIPEDLPSVEIQIATPDYFTENVLVTLTEIDTVYTVGPVPLFSTQVTITGTVFDDVGDELQGAQVTFSSLPGNLLAPVGLTTNIDGEYTANLTLPITEESIEITATFVGLDPGTASIPYGDLIGFGVVTQNLQLSTQIGD